jgi:hypothetical protein
MMDRWDAVILFGSLLIAAGWWFVWPPAVLFWLGAVVVILGISGARKP